MSHSSMYCAGASAGPTGQVAVHGWQRLAVTTSRSLVRVTLQVWTCNSTAENYSVWTAGLGKTFVIDHPTDPDRYLVHVCLEGPEAAVFYRGEVTLDGSSRATVTLPDYFDALTIPDSATVQVSHILDDDESLPLPVAATRVKDGEFTVRGREAGQSVAWRVEATRRDCHVEVEPLRKDVILHGDGPYKWPEKRLWTPGA